MSNVKISELTEANSVGNDDYFVVVENGVTYKIKFTKMNLVKSVNGKTGVVLLDASDVGAGTYSKPSGGIPKTDLAESVQTSLGKADSALQSAPVSSVNGQTGAVTLSIPATAADVGAIAAPNSPTTDYYLKFNGSAWVASQLPLYNGEVS